MQARADPFAQHDRADFAQEFLRRNRAYRAAWDTLGEAKVTAGAADAARAEAARWGLVRLFDPAAPVHAAPALWRPECASQVVSLAPAPQTLPGAAPLGEVAPIADLASPTSRDLVVAHDGVRHRLHVVGGMCDAPLAILLAPLGDPLRVAACDAARRMLAGRRIAEPRSALRPSPVQRRRLVLLLAVLDAARAGAGNRAIGTRIVYPWITDIGAAAWKASSERRRVQRLVAEARHLAASGYRALLHG